MSLERFEVKLLSPLSFTPTSENATATKGSDGSERQVCECDANRLWHITALGESSSADEELLVHAVG